MASSDEKYTQVNTEPDKIIPISVEINNDNVDTPTINHSVSMAVMAHTLAPLSLNTTKCLELSTQRGLLAPLELHTLDTCWHHLIPFVYNNLCKLICKNEKQLNKTKIDKLIKFIYNKYHLCCLVSSTVLYISWLLSGAYNYNHKLTAAVYWWFIIESMLLLYTANYRMFKLFIHDFTYWYKIISVTIGVISRMLVFDGKGRFLTDGWHMFSGISFIITYIVANQIIAGLKAYHWPFKYTVIFILFFCILNGVQVWQIYSSSLEFNVHFLGHTISLRNVAMSAYTNATIFYLQQLFMDSVYRNQTKQFMTLEWKVDESCSEIFYSGKYSFEKTLSNSQMKRLGILPQKT
eukprot:354322_1